MTNTKKKTITFLSIAVLLIVFFVVALIGQNMGALSREANADSVNEATAIRNKINSIMANGKEPSVHSNDGTPIGSEADLKNFLLSGGTNGKAYLTGNITFSWGGAFTNRLMPESFKELNGNGYTITLTANALASSNNGLGVDDSDSGNTNWAVALTNFDKNCERTYVTASDARKNLDVHGGLIGYLRPNQKIINCNFVYDQKINSGSQYVFSSSNSSSFGLVVGYSMGIIDNCSLTIGSNAVVDLRRDTNLKSSTGGSDYGQEAMSKHCFAMGGFAGTLANNAVVSNSKIVHNGNLKVAISARASGNLEYKDGNGRAWVGGIAGWMGNGSHVYNITTEGYGSFTARCENDSKNRTRSFAGIIAGVSGSDGTSGRDSLAGNMQGTGKIDGVINKWTGFANYLVNDTKYSPLKIANNAQRYLIVGIAGISGESSNVSNIYTMDDVYKGDIYTVSYDHSNSGARQEASAIQMQDVLGKIDGSKEFKSAKPENAYLIFSGTEAKAPLWAVYDLGEADAIMWSKAIYDPNDMDNPISEDIYYDKARSKVDAKRFDVTYTQIARDVNKNYIIRSMNGRAVYFTKSYGYGADVSNPNRVILSQTEYGGSLENPTIQTWADASCQNQELLEFTDSTYWYYVTSSNNTPRQVKRDEVIPIGTYEMFIYVRSTATIDYSYIHFINEAKRYVAYIEDDKNYQEFKKSHPDYSPVKDGEKQIDWQQRAIQEVKAKLTSVDWKQPSDVEVVSDRIEYDSYGKPVSFGRYSTTYDGEPVTFNLDIHKDDLVGSDTCSAIYEYRMLNDKTQEYEVVGSCVNAGEYKVVVTGLNNTNYRLAELSEGSDYCINFTIKQRQIKVANKIDFQLSEDGTSYVLKVPYEAAELDMASKVAVCFEEAEVKPLRANIVFYNILEIDKDIITTEYRSVDGADLDMRNVGKFDMQISMSVGGKSNNYILPEVTNYRIEICEVEAKFENTDDINYDYGLYFMDAKKPTVTGVGSDGVLSFGKGNKFYKMLEDGEYDMDNPSTSAPKDAGQYLVEFEFDYPNYIPRTISIRLTIKVRKVEVELSATHEEFIYGEKTVDSISVNLATQKPGSNTGILISEKTASKPTFRFQVIDAEGYETGVFVDKVVDVGRYIAHVGVDFTPGIYNGRVVDENTKYNYEVNSANYEIIVTKRPISVELNDAERVYGSEAYKFVGEANVEENRSWRYAEGSEEFLADDNIVIMPRLSDSDIFAKVNGSYTVDADLSDCSGDVVTVDGDNGAQYVFKKTDNYDITIKNATYKVLPKEVNVKVTLNTDNVIYGYDLPIPTVTVVGEGFFDHDNIEIGADWGDIVVGSGKGEYSVGGKIVSGEADNYKIVTVVSGDFIILPRTITIVGAQIENAQAEYEFDGTVRKPDVIFTYEGETFNHEKLDFIYNYFEVKNGIVDNVPTDDPTYAGVYRVYLADAASDNYTIAFGENYKRGSVTMTITKRNVSIVVKPGYRIYSIEGSLTPIARGIDETPGYHYFTREEAIKNGYGDVMLKPYSYKMGDDTPANEKFVQNNEDLGAEMYIDEYYKELGVRKGVIKLLFSGLVPDPFAIDADGNWTSEPQVEADGTIIENRYRNYTITMVPGDLHVLGADLQDVKQYVNLRSKEEVYDGTDKYEDFRVETTNDNIASALKFRVFRYVLMSSLSSSEASALAKEYGKYSQSVGSDGNFKYELDEDGTYVRKYIKRLEYGDSVDEPLTESGQYFKHITPAKEGIFTGEYITDFYITKATRDLSEIKVNATVYYNKIILSCDVEKMTVSVNGDTYVNKTTFDKLAPDTEYVIRIKFAETANYFATEDYIELKLRTGIDVTSVADTIKKLDKIDFSNISEFESKVLMFIDRIAPEDMAFIDVAKYAKLQASYEQLIKGANSVVMGAQKVGAKAVGKSNGNATKTATTVALSTGSLGMLFAVGMIANKRKKKDDEVREVKTRRIFSASKTSKTAFIAITVLIVCALMLAACDGKTEGFQKQDLFKIASYQEGASQDRDLTIEVKVGDLSLYKYENGVETKHDKIEAPAIKFGAEGKGFEFDDLYFDNAEFKDENGVATFNADIRETAVFLGVEDAVNGKVSVSVNSESKTLNSIDVSYDIVSSGITYNVVINVR